MTIDPGSSDELTILHDGDGPAESSHSQGTLPTTEIVEAYAKRERDLREELANLENRQDRLSNLRLLTGLATIGSAIWAAVVPAIAPIAMVVVLAAAFLLFVYRYRTASARSLRTENLAEINAESIARIHRNWDAIPVWHDIPIAASHPYANDLDIFGHGSLFQLLDTASTHLGETTLQSWLLAPASTREIDQRQKAVQELAPMSEWRQDLQMIGRIDSEERSDPDNFLAWAEGDRGFDQRGYLIWLARAGLALTIVVVVLTAAGVIDPAFLAIPLVANLVLSFGVRPLIDERISTARSQHDAMKSYGRLLEHLDTQAFTAPLLTDLTNALGGQERPAHQEVQRLGRITSWAVPRSALSHFPLQAIAIWDIHVLHALENWHRENGSRIRRWLRVIGVFEALSALANLSHDNPSWSFARIDLGTAEIDGRHLGHPLIADEHRVSNDVVVGPAGTFLLVTGSNMSGKSTLLRSIGVNIVLASAGGPSCATRFTLPPLTLWTSVRVSDSLEQGISFYMAELLRLKEIHSAAQRAHCGGEPFCYLLDEILQGTNSAERRIAAQHIIAELVGLGSIGAVSTHDLQLADAPELAGSAVAVHFSDSVAESEDGPSMSFDYRLRSGVATSTNALRLMRLVGFDMPVMDGRPVSVSTTD